MSNPPGKKGAEYEAYVLEKYLLPLWPYADRMSKHGIKDRGDFINCGPYTVEAKARETWALPEWIETVTQKAPKWWFLIFKKDKRGPLKKDYVLVEADLWFRVLAALPKEWLQ